MDNNERDLITKSVILRSDQYAMLIQVAKEQDRSVSGALRYIMDDWLSLKRTAIEAHRIQQEQPA